ncbi:MAG: hypothetical protein Q7T07_09275 [Burkholderiaceae bacterium]|nr:hypothetical protein [Burkholderiaceae bacterium]
MTPQDFIAKWGHGGPSYELNERQGAQPHFMDLCALLGVPTPDSSDDYLFEQGTLMLGEARGYADVFKRGCFAWENKAPGRNLDTALKQLLGYSHALSNPPLLVVCDRLTIRIHTQFTGHPSEVHRVNIDELTQPDKLKLLRRVWLDPESFRPKKTTRDITEAAAKSFATLADRLRNRGLVLDKKGSPTGAGLAVNHPEVVAHFLTQCLFCFFADDVQLLPQRLFEGLVNNTRITPAKLTTGLTNLFTTMQQGGLYGNDDIPWFNGGLFKKINVPQLDILDVTELRNAAALNWTAIDVSIFGTLFERGLDPKKRSQLGAHYTDPATIARIIDPVIRRPLLQKWEQSKQEIRRLMAISKAKNDKNYKLAKAAFVRWLEDLQTYRILDPACGSGNFLFLGLKVLKDIEHQSHLDAETLGLDREADLVTGPHNMLGLELNEYAAELARVTVWIGELQWRLTHGYEFKTNPVLEPLDCIECRDALLRFTPETPTVRAEPVEADWPQASVVVGNPPFLGGSKKRRELGDAYFEALNKVFAGRVPGGADLVCYWFDKALKAIEIKGLGAAGLVSTNSIRGGANRKVLDAICEKSAIFEAWSDEGWVNDGAAVRVSLIAFGHAGGAVLNGEDVPQIYADLTAPKHADDLQNLSTAQTLACNLETSFQGSSKKAKFEIDAKLARDWLRLPNPHNKPNSDVLKPWANGFELSRGPQHQWIIDFGNEMPEQEAALYEQPFAYVTANIKPERILKSEPALRDYWWRFGRPRVDLRIALKPLPRYIATVAHSKHRFFVWLPAAISPDQALITFARSDDTTFGLLHSRFHEVWSLRMGTSIGVGNDPRYTPTTCFETFPFPAGLTPQDTASQQTRRLASGAVVPDVPSKAAETIAEAAHKLTTLRDNWLNPPDWTQRLPEVVPLGMSTSPYPDRIVPKHGHEKELSERTLTKLYNARPAWLSAAHAALDAAVATAYGWTDYTPDMPDETILQRLLALNVARSQSNAKA